MSRQITYDIVRAFNNSYDLKRSNSEVIVDNEGWTNMYLFDNMIAKKNKEGELYITNAGWMSNTTKERLNGLSGVSIQQKKHKWYLNGEEWDGSWKLIGRGNADFGSVLKSTAIVAMMGDIFGANMKESNDWKKRMLKAGIGEGVDIPDDWDQLPEEEKKRRLDGAIGALTEN